MRKILKAIIGFFKRIFKDFDWQETKELVQKVVNVTEAIKGFIETSNIESFLSENAYSVDDKIYNTFLKVADELHWGLGIVELGEDGNKLKVLKAIAERIKFNYTHEKERLGIYHMIALEVTNSLLPKIDKSILSVVVTYVYSRFVKRAI